MLPVFPILSLSQQPASSASTPTLPVPLQHSQPNRKRARSPHSDSHFRRFITQTPPFSFAATFTAPTPPQSPLPFLRAGHDIVHGLHHNDSRGFLQHCPEDILTLLLSHLDALSLVRTGATCRYIYSAAAMCENGLWSRRCRIDWDLRSKEDVSASWRENYINHYNSHTGQIRAMSLCENAVLDYKSDGETSKPKLWFERGVHYSSEIGQSRKEEDVGVTERERRYVMTWPAHPANAYIIAMDRELVVWVDTENECVINVSSVEESREVNASAMEGLEDGTKLPGFGKLAILKGHDVPIGLILSNGEGMVASFDEGSVIRIWNIEPLHRLRQDDVIPTSASMHVRAIDAQHELGFIFSMNVHKRRVIAGGRNGRVIVWNVDDGSQLVSLNIPEAYVPFMSLYNLLNVAIWEDVVVYGLFDGTYFVYDIAKGRMRFVLRTSDWAEARGTVSASQLVAPAPTPAMASQVASAQQSGDEDEYEEEFVDEVMDYDDFVTAEEDLFVKEMEVEYAVAMGGGSGSSSSSSSSHSGPSTFYHVHLDESLMADPMSPLSASYSSAGYGLSNPHVAEQSIWGPSTSNQPPLDLQFGSYPPSSSSSSSQTTAFATISSSALPPHTAPPSTIQHPAPAPPPAAPQQPNFAPDAFAFNATDSLAPMTLSLNSHVMITNGARRSELYLWDLRSGELLHVLTESDGCEDSSSSSTDGHTWFHNNNAGSASETEDARGEESALLPPPELKFAELSKDGTMVYASVETRPNRNARGGYGGERLVVWDFRGDGVQRRVRSMEKWVVVSGVHAYDGGKVDAGVGRVEEGWIGDEEVVVEDERREMVRSAGGPAGMVKPMEFWVCYDEVETRKR
ncbi:hypothetical protein BJ742DRAFT_832002 [Cladochytrium replicatum]|nr:hypothetical protein BJ742DRAFT_832002 [Cladochytrium replicatum]